ncbi:MAG: tRNA uridine-5-carboxymethylaminomethyl(34) synthesis GTPase MnmE [Spirochaetes bacterium]|nr:tRNA uridine-5-carboxymethylaminomethyl(34) synthesis GTPase MnmE [Spirochaetota bacterium]
MVKNREYDIIFANSSGAESTKAISIFRLSGGRNLLFKILNFIIFSKKIENKLIKDLQKNSKEELENTNLENFKIKRIRKLQKLIRPRYAYFVKIINPFYNSQILESKEYEELKKIKLIDEGIFIFYKAPYSYTGENMVELFVHGSKIIEYILTKLFILAGFSIAKNGEFTKRAFLNGKIDLIQAQAINNLINSKSLISYQTSLNNLQKKFSNKIFKIKNYLFDAISYLEASLDYPEEELYDNIEMIANIKNLLNQSLNEIDKLLKNSSFFKIINEGIKIVISGPTNTGKSSFFNLLLNEDRAIVSEIHGTTRDYLEGNINIKNIAIKIFDSPGIRESYDPVEIIGIERIQKIIEEADLILFLLSPDEKLNKKNIEKIINHKDKVVFILNKFDLIDKVDNFLKEIKLNANIEDFQSKLTIEKFSFLINKYMHNTSFYENLTYNIDFIKQNFGTKKIIIPSSTIDSKEKTIEIFNYLISFIFNFDNIINEPPYIQNEREIFFLNNLKLSITNSLDLLEKNQYFDMIAEELSLGLRNILELTGEDYNETLYENIFNKFCLGK